MSKSKSIYVGGNVDNVIHRIESIIDFGSHATDYMTQNTVQKKMKTVHFNIKMVS